MELGEGVYRAADLRRQGVTGWQIRRAVETRMLRPLRHGWYATAAANPVVVEAVSKGGVLSCVSALRHHGLWVPPDRRVHFRVPPFRMTRHSCHGHGPLPAIADSVDDVLVAFACAARCLSAESLVVVADSILNSGRYEIADLRGALSAAPTCVRILLDRCDPGAQSGTESIARLRLRALRIMVRTQVYLVGVGRVDLLVGNRLIIECDSELHHTSRPNYQNDRTRDRVSLVNGYLTMRLTYADVMFHWDEVVEDILRIVRRGDHLVSPQSQSRDGR